MGTTKIPWAEKTWNPVTGCTKISEGCRNCYAERMARRLAGRYGYPEAPHHFDVTFHPDRLDQPLRWKKPSTIFVCSMGDLFHKDVVFEQIDRVWQVMFDAKQHSFLVLTKRPQRMLEWYEEGEIQSIWPHGDLPLPNVYLGVTVENQDTLWRVDELVKIPAAGHWVSLEPMLSAVDIKPYLYPKCGYCGGVLNNEWNIGGQRRCCRQSWGEEKRIPPLSGVVLGGESGPSARPMHPDWARKVRDDCEAAGVPFHLKSWGAWAYRWDDPESGGPIYERVGAKRAGRTLDGREHNEAAWGMP